MQRNRPDHFAADGGAAQGRLDDKPVERMMAIIERLGGIPHAPKGKPPYGRDLQCPLCQQLKDRMKIDIPTHRLKIDIGKLPNALVVRCTRVSHNQNALVSAVTKATRLSLMPRPSPSEIRDRMLYKVGQMRLTTKYKDRSDLSKALVEHLVEAVIVKREPNGEVLRSTKDWMLALDTRSSSQTVKAIDAALASGLIGRRRTASPTLEGGRPSFLYGLKCLPTETGRKWSETCFTDEARPRNKPRNKPSKRGINPKKPLDIVESDSESYAVVGDYPPSEAQADPAQGLGGQAIFSFDHDDAWPP
jgi:hypothetical protein